MNGYALKLVVVMEKENKFKYIFLSVYLRNIRIITPI